MCGIVGYVGPDEALPIVVEGLRRLGYRGYDSSGVAVLKDGLRVVKRAGKLSELDSALRETSSMAGTTAMGHTRWATHGAPTDLNAHPHTDCGGRVAVIHNGIIENFQSLRGRLEKAGHTLASETDTECVAHLIEEKRAGGAASLSDAVRAAVGELEGAYSLVVCAQDAPGLHRLGRGDQHDVLGVTSDACRNRGNALAHARHVVRNIKVRFLRRAHYTTRL